MSRSFAALLAASMLASCPAPMSSTTYAASQVGSVNRAVQGEIISVRAVKVDRNTGVGGAAGAGLGALGGSTAGSNVTGSLAGAVAGAVVGGIIGNAIERSGSQAGAQEYVVRAENGALLTLVQADPAIPIGAKVIVMYGSPARIIIDGSRP